MDAIALRRVPCSRSGILSPQTTSVGSLRVYLPFISSPLPLAQYKRTNVKALARAAFEEKSEGRTWRVSATANGHPSMPANLAVFVSGGGSNFKSIHSGILEERINGRVVVVVSDKPECGGCEYARSHGIPVLAYPLSKKFAPEGLSPKDLVEQLKAAGVEYVLLAGFLKLIPVELCQAFPRAILNIHPALLPAFGGKGYYGMRVHEAVVRTGARVSGPTIHFVDEEFDNGPIVAQSAVPVYHTDTPADVQKRVLAEEHKLYPAVVEAVCSGRIAWREDGVPYVEEVSKEVSVA